MVDQNRFDHLAVMLSRRAPRRPMVAMLGGALLLRGVLDEEATAKGGAAGGQFGGRHGANQRGRGQHRAGGTKQHKKRNQHGGEPDYRNCSQVPKVPGADLSNCDLRGVNLAQADLHGANLSNAVLVHVDMNHANLSDADLTNAELRWADLSWADLTNVNWTTCGCPSGPTADPTCCDHLDGAIPVAGC